MSEPYAVTITVPRGLILHSNQRLHWAPKAQRTRMIRRLAAVAAHGCPRLARAHLTIRVTWADRRRRDVHNLQPTIKASIDGMIEAGILPDDSDAYLTGPDLRTTDPDPTLNGVRLRFEWVAA